MAKPGIEELLIGCVMDPQLLRRLRQSPESVFDEYELSDRAREILTSPDERVLELLGESVTKQSGEHPTADSKTDAPRRQGESVSVASDDQSTSAVSLAESRLALRLVPYLQQSTESMDDTPSVLVNYAGHLDALPEGTNVDDLPDVPTAVTDGRQLPPVSVVVAVQPTIWTDNAGNQQITFSVNAQLPNEAAAHRSEVAAGGPDSMKLSPWRHEVDSPAVRAAATRVQEAEASERHHRLLELIDVMVRPDATPGAEQ